MEVQNKGDYLQTLKKKKRIFSNKNNMEVALGHMNRVEDTITISVVDEEEGEEIISNEGVDTNDDQVEGFTETNGLPNDHQ